MISLARERRWGRLVNVDVCGPLGFGLLRNDLLPPRYPVCGLWQFQLPGQFGRSFRPPAEFGLGARY